MFKLLKTILTRWNDHEAPRMSAALSYYTVFSIAPLLLLSLALASLIFDRTAAQDHIFQQIRYLIGDQSAQAIRSMLVASGKPASGITAGIVSVVTLLFGASGVFLELSNGLNRVWETEAPTGFKAFLKRRAKLFGMVLGIGFLLLVSLIVSALLAALGDFISLYLPVPTVVLHLLNAIISLAIVTILFALLYKFLPNTRIAWKDVWLGSLVTSLLFTVGKAGIALYLGKAVTASTYGAAGSVLILLLWIFYSGLIFYLGAEFTHLYANHFGSRKGSQTKAH